MPANLRTLPALLLTTLVALSGAAAADVPLAGLVDVSVHADASGAQALAEQTLAQAQATADATQADAHAQVQAGADVAADAGAQARSGLADGFHAFGGWLRGLLGMAQETKAEVHAQVDAPDASVPPTPGLLAAFRADLSALLHVG